MVPSLRAGALGYLLETCSLDELVSAIHSVYDGEEVFTPKAAADALHHLVDKYDEIGYPGDLHPRELEVLKLVSNGLSNRHIANELNISERTVSTHLANIFSKLGVSSRTGAAACALKKGLITFDDL